MIRERFGYMVALCLGNGVLLGIALAGSRPVYHLALAAAVGTAVNLSYILAGRLWEQR